MRYSSILWILSFCIQSCGPDCWTMTWTVDDEYTVSESSVTKTPLGIRVDGYSDADLNEIDSQVIDVLNCLRSTSHETKSLRLCVECITVKIDKDWSWSCDSKQQLLRVDAPQYLCDEKGFHTDPNCPCKWRAVIESPAIIVVTPNLALFKDAFLRYVTGVYNPWLEPELVECMK